MPLLPKNDPHTLLTPAMRDVLARMARARRQPLQTLTPADARAAYEAGATASTSGALSGAKRQSSRSAEVRT